jgi:Tol biopolymer transport system component
VLRRLALLVLPLLAVACGPADDRAGKPQNGLIASVTEEGIVLLGPDGSRKGVVPGTKHVGEVVWSPDGDQLAFTIYEGDKDLPLSALYVIRPDGTDRKLVLRNALDPSWSPDGKRFVITRDSCPSAEEDCVLGAEANPLDLYTVAADGTDLRPLATGPDYQGDGEWSPDGEWIAFMGSRQDGLYVIRPDGTDRRLLVGKDGLFGQSSWSPDGSKIAFEDVADIGIVDVETGRETILSRQGYDFAPEWSPDGTQIAFLATLRCFKTGECTAHEPWEVWVMSPEGKDARPLTKGGLGRPSWAPAPAPSN